MKPQQSVYNMLAKADKAQKQEFGSMKVELSLMSDFIEKYEKAVDESAALGNAAIDALGVAETAANKIKEASKMYQEAYDLGVKLQKSAEQLGIELDAIQLNKIEIAKRSIQQEIALANAVVGYINQAYKAF
jgi:hypothetical protein